MTGLPDSGARQASASSFGCFSSSSSEVGSPSGSSSSGRPRFSRERPPSLHGLTTRWPILLLLVSIVFVPHGGSPQELTAGSLHRPAGSVARSSSIALTRPAETVFPFRS